MTTNVTYDFLCATQTGPHVRDLEWDDFEHDECLDCDELNQKSNSDPELHQAHD